MYNELKKRVDKRLLNKFSIFTDLHKANFTKKSIYWTNKLPNQETAHFLNDLGYIKRINYFVFSSFWQLDLYRKNFDIPDSKVIVIKYACPGLEQELERDNNKIKVCYTSTPWRGLDILLEAWKKIKPDDAELHVFSGAKVYGNEFYTAEDDLHNFLYNKCDSISGVKYRKEVDNISLRKELSSFDILAYPCTYEEPSCVNVVDGISAGLRVITSSLGSIPEMSEGWARIYPAIAEHQQHINTFADILEQEIEAVRDGIYDDQSSLQKEIYAPAWSWDERLYDWQDFLESVS
jgi:glycosyltransferase involved in cell wall biosynthesis